jgi:hypothetical protein
MRPENLPDTCRSGHEFNLSVQLMTKVDDREMFCISESCLFKRLPLALLTLSLGEAP